MVFYDAPRCILCFRCVRVCDEGMGVEALGVGKRGATSEIVPNRGDHLECDECGMCIDICPVGALTSGTYRYKTRPWEMEHVGTICTHCSNGCKTTLGVRNDEIMRGEQPRPLRHQRRIPLRQGPLRFRFHQASGTPQAAHGAARNANSSRSPGKKRRRRRRRASSRFTTPAEKTPSGSLVRTARRTKKIICSSGWRAQTFGTNNVDHHRTVDYTGLVTALGERAHDSMLTMEELYQSKAVLVIGNDPTNQNPLVAWQIRSGIRHFGTKLFIINANDIKLERKATQFVKVAAGHEGTAVRWLAHGEGNLAPEMVEQLMRHEGGAGGRTATSPSCSEKKFLARPSHNS